MDREKAIAMANTAARKRKQERKTPAEEQIKKLFSKPCVIRWSNGAESTAVIGDVFFTEEAYDRYKAYKDSGKAYPVEIEILPLQDPAAVVFPEDPEGERKLCETISLNFTQALKQYVAGTGEPVDIPKLLDEEAAAEIDRRAEDGQKELQRLADEADEAIRGTL